MRRRALPVDHAFVWSPSCEQCARSVESTVQGLTPFPYLNGDRMRYAACSRGRFQLSPHAVLSAHISRSVAGSVRLSGPSSNAPPFTGPTRDDLLVPLINMYSVFSPVCRLHRRRRLRGLYAVVTSLVRVTCSCSLRFGCSSLTTAVSRLAGVASARDVGELHSPTTQQYVSCASLLLAITNFREL